MNDLNIMVCLQKKKPKLRGAHAQMCEVYSRDRSAADGIVLVRLVVNDDALGLHIVAKSINAAKALPQTIEARGLGDQGVEIEVRARFETLGANNNALAKVIASRSACLDGRPQVTHHIVTVERAHRDG